MQKPTTRFINGKVMARPEIAIGPTPRPMKILSTILYKDVATAAIIAGTEYCTSNLPMVFVPKVSCEGGEGYDELILKITL